MNDKESKEDGMRYNEGPVNVGQIRIRCISWTFVSANWKLCEAAVDRDSQKLRKKWRIAFCLNNLSVNVSKQHN